MPFRDRPLGLRLIVIYKFVKGPLVVALAVFLTLSPRGAEHVAARLAHDLSEGGVLFARLARWISHDLTRRTVLHAAMVAWLDGIVTVVEGVLLLRGHAWGEWLVVAALAALVPFEIASLVRHAGLLKLTAIVLNVAIVVYLAWRRLTAERVVR